jgi:hypothetical protein
MSPAAGTVSRRNAHQERERAMGKVVVGLSVSADGFIAGANDGPENPLGEGGERLFRWMTAGVTRTRYRVLH